MRTLPTLLAAHTQLGTTTLAYALKITRRDSAVYAFTIAVDPVVLSGVTYNASTGLDISSIENEATLAVDNLELTTLDDGTTFSRADVLGGLWKNADFTVYRYNFVTPSDGVEIIMRGTIGNVQLRASSVVAELRGLQQILQQPIGSVTSSTCRARLGDDRCTVNLTPLTFTGTITSVASSQVFTDTSKTQAADYFGEGSVTFTSGACAGHQQKIKTFSAGVFTLSLPMVSALAVGNTFTVIAGCRKRMAEDCATKFSNVLNFQGEPHLPGIDALGAV